MSDLSYFRSFGQAALRRASVIDGREPREEVESLGSAKLTRFLASPHQSDLNPIEFVFVIGSI